ncbi:MAG TPA: hypothetical protein VKG26_00330, partial [Bacteroidia bacterium]|nr:hypothetical protein [Bacteroidia bacterium]
MYKKTTLSIKVIGFLLVLLTQTLKAQIANQTPVVSPTAICGTGTATVTIPSSEVGVTYALTDGVSLIGTPVSGTGNSISFPTGTLTVTTTFIVGATNGTSTVTMNPPVTVTVNPLPNVSISASHTAICKGAVDTLTASGAVNYTWAPGGATTTTETVAPTSTTTATNYTLTGTDANGCTNTSTISITVNPVPTLSI